MSTFVTEPAAIGAGDRALVAGDPVGEYVVRDQIGKGGFGTVYRAVQPVIGKVVAIKVLARKYSADEEVVSRFVAEARAVNQIRHRNIIDIFSFGQLPDGRHYYVMEYLDGTPLDRYLHEVGALRLEAALPILRAIARALDAAHAKGIAHRDLKPENIVLTFDDEGNIFPKLLDFGIAKLSAPEADVSHKTGTGVPLGTPYYMSPEQCRGRDVDHRTDIYSFGVLAFRLLTGAYPFTGELIEVLHKHMHEEPPPPSSLNPALGADSDDAIAWMMHKEAAQRPPTAMAALIALQGESTAPTPLITPPAFRPPSSIARASVQTADTLAAPTPSTLAPVPRARRPLWAGAAVLVLGAVIGVAVLQLRGGARGESGAGQRALPAEATPAVMPPPEVPVAVTPDAAVTATPRTVIVMIADAPEGAVVKLADKEIGVAPKVQLAYSTEEMVLTLYADGYVPTPIEVTPDRAQTVNGTMKPKPRAAGKRPPRPQGKDAIITDIPGLTR